MITCIYSYVPSLRYESPPFKIVPSVFSTELLVSCTSLGAFHLRISRTCQSLGHWIEAVFENWESKRLRFQGDQNIEVRLVVV
jgi:hypothetical protein